MQSVEFPKACSEKRKVRPIIRNGRKLFVKLNRATSHGFGGAIDHGNAAVGDGDGFADDEEDT